MLPLFLWARDWLSLPLVEKRTLSFVSVIPTLTGCHVPKMKPIPGSFKGSSKGSAPGRYHVLNLGLPGMTPFQIAVRLADWIEQYNPQSVVVCAGINSYWNRTNTEERNQEEAVAH